MNYLERLKNMRTRPEETHQADFPAIDTTQTNEAAETFKVFQYSLYQHPGKTFFLLAPGRSITEAARLIGRAHGPANVLTVKPYQRPTKPT